MLRAGSGPGGAGAGGDGRTSTFSLWQRARHSSKSTVKGNRHGLAAGDGPSGHGTSGRGVRVVRVVRVAFGRGPRGSPGRWCLGRAAANWRVAMGQRGTHWTGRAHGWLELSVSRVKRDRCAPGVGTAGGDERAWGGEGSDSDCSAAR